MENEINLNKKENKKFENKLERCEHGNTTRVYFFFGILLVALGLAGLIYYKFLAPIIVAGVLTVIFRPMYDKMRRHLSLPGSLSAILTILIITIIILAPLFLIGTQVFNEVRSMDLNSATNMASIDRLNNTLNSYIGRIAPGQSVDLYGIVRSAAEFIGGNIGNIFSTIAHFLFSFFLMVVILFYLLKDGHSFKTELIRLSPLPDESDVRIFNKVTLAVNSVVKGSLLVGVIQGIMAFLGFTIFGVPNPALLGGLTAIAALIPGVGTSLVMVPVIAYMFIAGSIPGAIGILLWAVIAVGLVDNFIGPMFIGRGVKIHPLLILLSVLGGLIVFGAIGFLLGPLIISFLFALLDIYSKDFSRNHYSS